MQAVRQFVNEIETLFTSKPIIESDTKIMVGIPVWTILVGFGTYVYWNKRQQGSYINELTGELKELKHHQLLCLNRIEALEKKQLIAERDEKATMHLEIVELKRQLQALQSD